MDDVRTYFDGDVRFYRYGVQEIGMESEHILLSFVFPDSISEKERKQISKDIKKRTGWDSTFSNSIRHEAFQPLLGSLLERPVEMPSVHLQNKVVIANENKADNGQAIADQFQKKTGFTLQFANDNASRDVPTGSSDLFSAKTGVEPMENNQAIAVAKQYGKDYGVSIYKTSMKTLDGQPMMEVHFISPQVALKYTDMLQALSDEIGMTFQYAKQPKQNEILRITKEIIPDAWEMKGNPSIHMDTGHVSVKAGNEPETAEMTEIDEKIMAETGYRLEVR